MKIGPIVRGDSSSFAVDPFWDEDGDRELGPLDGWTLKFYIKGGGNTLEVTADTDWNVALTAVQTAALTAGICSFFLYASKALERKMIDTGSIQIFANGAAADGTFDGRSFNRKMLEKIRTALLARADGLAIESYVVNGRDIKYSATEDLIKLESEFLRRVAKEESTTTDRQASRIKHLRYRG